jgi:hypothetical protein
VHFFDVQNNSSMNRRNKSIWSSHAKTTDWKVKVAIKMTPTIVDFDQSV